jgi:polysaccharide biosynthesis protein PslH
LAENPSIKVTSAVADIRPYLRGASAAVAPLRVARGVQNKIIEAMAMGLPVAASSRAAMALPERLRRDVHLEDDPHRLAEFLLERLQSPSVPRPEPRRAVLDYISDLAWNERLEGILLSAANSPRQQVNDSTNVSEESWAIRHQVGGRM